MPQTRECDYCGAEIEPGTGTMFVRTDGTTIHYCSAKCEKNADLDREARDLSWTDAGRGTGGHTTQEASDEAEPTHVDDEPAADAADEGGTDAEAESDASEADAPDDDATDAGSDSDDVDSDETNEAATDDEEAEDGSADGDDADPEEVDA